MWVQKNPDMNEKLELVVASLTIASVIVAVFLYTIPLSENQITAIYIFDFIVVILLAVQYYNNNLCKGMVTNQHLH